MRNPKKNNLNLFSEKLTSELENILKKQRGVEQDGVSLQEVGRNIAQFVFLKEAKNNEGGVNDITRTSWV